MESSMMVFYAACAVRGTGFYLRCFYPTFFFWGGGGGAQSNTLILSPFRNNRRGTNFLGIENAVCRLVALGATQW